MTVSFHARPLLLTAAFLVAFGAVLSSALDARTGVTVGVLAVVAYAAVEACLFFQPAALWRGRRAPRD